MSKCLKCGSELKEGQKFCIKCGTPASVRPQLPKAVKQQSQPSLICAKCGAPVKFGQKFCIKCGEPISPPKQEAEVKGWFANGVRAIANAVTGGALNREIERQQQVSDQQARNVQGQIQEAHQGQQTTNRAQRSTEQGNMRARDRRYQEVIDGIDVVRGRAIWNIQLGEIARRVTETEFNEIENLRGVIIQEGCTALVYVDGEQAGALSGGAYTFPVKSEDEKKAEREEAERKVSAEERKKNESFMERGLVGTIGIGLNTVRRFFFGIRKDESEHKRKTRKEKIDKILKEKAQSKLIRVYLVNERLITFTFGGQQNAYGGIDFIPFHVPTKFVDVDIAVSLQMQITNINDFLRNYLADRDSVTTNQVQQMIVPTVQTLVCQLLRNLDYQQDGLSEPVLNNLRMRIQNAINEQLFGIQCLRVLQITDRSADFERFRQVECELFCSEKELGYLRRTGEFRNRLVSETNKQAIDKASSEEELRFALLQINKDRLLHDDEMEQFALMLSAQKHLREAKSQEEEYETLLDLKKSRLVKDDEMAVLEDVLSQNKIQRDSVTEIMRIQHQQSIDDARLHAQWALDNQKQDHDWEREDLQRRRNWGIEDEQREREWMHEEQEYNRQWRHTEQQDEYDWQKRIRETDFDWQQQERQREAKWEQRLREEQISRENEQTAYDHQRETKFDDIDILDRKAQIVQRNIQAMKEAELRELQEQNRSAESIHGMDVQKEMNRDNIFANMSPEQIRSAQLDHLTREAQVAMADAYNKDGENELLQKQQQEQKELYEKMMQSQQQTEAQNQEMLLKMAQMMQQGMLGTVQQQQDFQQQRFEDQRQRADEYRKEAQRQQDRLDRVGDQALDYTTRTHQTDSQSFAQAIGSAPQVFQQTPQQTQSPAQAHQSGIQPPAASEEPNVPHLRLETQVSVSAEKRCYCPACGAEVLDGEMYCGECGNRIS